MKKRISRLPNLKYERELRGWSQADVANYVESDAKSVSRWERGEHLPGPFHMQKLIELFGKNALELGLLGDRKSKPTVVEKGEADPWDWGEAPMVADFYG